MKPIGLEVNGRRVEVHVAPEEILLHVLRDKLHLTGAKEFCAEGECGACTVIIDGRSINSCLVLAVETEHARITTVEGLAGVDLSPLQSAFLDNAAAQCGFCIPGQLMAAEALLQHTPAPSTSQIREALAGNFCRCAGYPQIINAVEQASGEAGG